MSKSLKAVTSFHNPYLSISAPPYSYSMDLMEISSHPVRSKDKPFHIQRNILNSASTSGNKYILVLIETTSRKLFAYPLKNKTSEEVFKAFEKFMDDAADKVNGIISDSGGEYKKIWDEYEISSKNKDGIKFYKVVADNVHTPLAMVDRVIRTLRMMIYIYFSEYQRYDWDKALPDLVDIYNNTEHSSLFVKHGRRKYRFTPSQVWMSPAIADKIRLKDKKRGKKGQEYIDKKFKEGEEFYYVIGGDSFSKNGKRGYISEDTVIIQKRVGNQFQVYSQDPKINGKLIPYQKLIPIYKTRGKLTSSVFNMGTTMGKEVKKEKPTHIKPSAEKERIRLSRNYLFDKDSKEGIKDQVIKERLRSESRIKKEKEEQQKKRYNLRSRVPPKLIKMEETKINIKKIKNEPKKKSYKQNKKKSIKKKK